jgi:hypothetical protein
MAESYLDSNDHDTGALRVDRADVPTMTIMLTSTRKNTGAKFAGSGPEAARNGGRRAQAEAGVDGAL